MKKYEDLIKNIGVLTISNFGSKLFSFFLVPLYTAILSTEEYGNFDFITTTVSLLIPIFTLNISEAALRFLLDKDKDKKDICKISIRIVLISIVIVTLLSIANKFFGIIDLLNNYLGYFIVYYIVLVIYTYAQNITRGLDKISDVAIGGVINSLFMLILNILFLVILKLGLDGYFLASIIANVISTAYLLISIKYHKLINCKKIKNHNLQKEMINYSKPLMMNSIGWWINNVSDRYIVIYLCGAAANGVYSVSYKIPSILSIFQTIFNQAWGISAVKEFDKDDKDHFFKNVYSSYNFLMVFCCSILIILSKILAHFLYLREFYSAWQYMPFLMISIVFGSLSGLLGGVFSAVKDSKILGGTTILGAILNIILNLILVYKIGIIGAAIATAISYFIVWAIRLITSRKYIRFNINLKRDILSYILLIGQSIILVLMNQMTLTYLLEIIILIIELILYHDEIKRTIKNCKERLKNEK